MIKAQLVICALTLSILSVVLGKGQQHDFSLFKDSGLLLHPDAHMLADSGYHGMHRYHRHPTLPIKKPKGQSLSAEDKATIKRFQNGVFSSNMSTADARFSKSLKTFTGVNTKITRSPGI